MSRRPITIQQRLAFGRRTRVNLHEMTKRTILYTVYRCRTIYWELRTNQLLLDTSAILMGGVTKLEVGYL